MSAAARDIKPTPPERLEAKFESCAARALSDAGVTQLYAALDDLQDAGSVRDITREMETSRLE